MENINKDVQKKLFELLLKSRLFEEKLIEMIQGGQIAGWLHPMLGQEAVGVGVAVHLKKTDSITNTHRGRAISIAKGVPLKRFLAEVLGRAEGPCGGVAGEMHFCDAENGILGNSGLVGATIPIAAGVALASKLLGLGQVVVNVCGDGGVDEGNFHETINIASVWKLPMVFVVENNGWAQFTPQRETTAQPDIWRKAEGYNMPGVVADGADVMAVYKTAGEAIERARRGDGPTLIEYKLNRWLGHYIGDPQAYRDPKDIAKAKEMDPLIRYKDLLIKKRVITQANVQEMERSIGMEINEAVEYANNLSPAKADQAFQNVYA